MPELSIELTPKEHERLRERAMERGESVERYARDLITGEREDDLKELHAFLNARMTQVEAGHVVRISADHIKRQGRARLRRRDAD